MPKPKTPPQPSDDSWKPGAVALLAVMTPAGQKATLRAWATLDPPFRPPLPGAPPPKPLPTPPKPEAAPAPALFAET